MVFHGNCSLNFFNTNVGSSVFHNSCSVQFGHRQGRKQGRSVAPCLHVQLFCIIGAVLMKVKDLFSLYLVTVIV